MSEEKTDTMPDMEAEPKSEDNTEVNPETSAGHEAAAEPETAETENSDASIEPSDANTNLEETISASEDSVVEPVAPKDSEPEETKETIEEAAVKNGNKKLQDEPVKHVTSAGGADKKWYAVRTITGHEKRVKNYLESEITEIGLEDRIAQVLIPEEKVFEVKGGKKKIKYKNFFPGYVLVEAALDKEIINFLSHAPSVLKMVGDKNEAIALRDDEVNRIIGRINDSDEKEKIDMQFEKGDLIKVVSGPFVSFNGTINEINLERMKVKVMVSIFGRKTPIELDFAQIEKEK